MHALVEVLFNAFMTLETWTASLGDLIDHMMRGLQSGLVLATILVTSVLVFGLGCSWALFERLRASAAHYRMSGTLARAQSEIRFREAMILASPQAVVVMGADMSTPLSYRGGSALLQECLSGPDSAALTNMVDALLESGAPFDMRARTERHPSVAVRGSIVGSRAAVFLHPEEGSPALERDLKSLLEAMPVPVWIRGRDLSLTWANRAFLAATGSGSLEKARKADPRIVRAERDLVEAALEGRDVLNERRYSVIDGRRRALSVDVLRLPSERVAGVALDVTESAQAEGQLRLMTEAQSDMLDRLGTALAIFGADRKLASWNKAFAAMWSFEDAWLDRHPALEDIFDRLRETRRIPEQRDYQIWRREHLALFEDDDGEIDEAWHTPSGINVRVKAHPHLMGGLFYLFEDISETLRLSTQLHLLAQTQRATLDAFGDGMAVFGPDGRLKMHNAAFAEMWKLSEQELMNEPHLGVLAQTSITRIGRDGIWNMIASGITSQEPAHCGEWGRVLRADGRVLALRLTRLPLGAVLVAFEDNTDLERFAGDAQGASAA
ncbi:MAG: PAS domain-containing protein [Alphaproteobacteria bacterium]|nr:PAS domain-containing protein [Alphaproteobacteria bacterium]MBL6937702.1 PAS domain-containing protein [Alphaproteobacteria bacterium]MBL7099040.1 PAS domain-containing protein [Alphaproteobacteria bacterium]